MSRGQRLQSERLHRLGLASVREPPRANLFRSVCSRVLCETRHGSQSRGYEHTSRAVDAWFADNLLWQNGNLA